MVNSKIQVYRGDILLSEGILAYEGKWKQSFGAPIVKRQSDEQEIIIKISGNFALDKFSLTLLDPDFPEEPA